MKIVITGANGFIGSHLADFFSEKGWQVISLTRKEFDFTKMPDEKYFQDANVLIHCAFIKNSFEENVEGTKQLVERTRKQGIKKYIFLSSISAKEDAVSLYGKQKFACEKFFKKENDWIIRSGLVIGNGGLFKEMTEFVRRKKIIPLIDGGKQPMQTIYIGDLCSAIENGIEKNISGISLLAEAEPITYKEFYTTLCKWLNVKATFIPLSYFLINILLFIPKFLGIKLPVTRENLKGLKKLETVNTQPSIEKIGITLRSFWQSLEALNK
ncbi:MAG: NAD(P)-dependent oxidoreductase [Bacteroidetes bacterium]|nr:NAD(P)-dependent oxidoreductase [Bacteroidota bacterium]